MISSAQFQSKTLAAAIPVVPRKGEDGKETLVIDRWADGADAQDMALNIIDPKKFAQVQSGEKVMTDRDKGAEVLLEMTIGGKGNGSHAITSKISLDRYAEMAGFREHHGALAADAKGLWFVAYK